MGEIILTFKGMGGSTVPLEADPITPDLLQLKVRAEIERLPLYHGNEQLLLGDFFSVKGERSNQIRLRGDLSQVKNIGVGMQTGRIVIESSIGMHVGARMAGGEIQVHGNAGDWAGGGGLHAPGTDRRSRESGGSRGRADGGGIDVRVWSGRWPNRGRDETGEHRLLQPAGPAVNLSPHVHLRAALCHDLS